MKKLLFTSLLSLGLLSPVSISASIHNADSTIKVFVTKTKKSKTKKSRKIKRNTTRNSRSYSQSKSCTYNGNQLFVGKRGGCYYYSGNSKQYVDRSYCSGCN